MTARDDVLNERLGSINDNFAIGSRSAAANQRANERTESSG